MGSLVLKKAIKVLIEWAKMINGIQATVVYPTPLEFLENPPGLGASELCPASAKMFV